jgi:hypothetical protein
MIGAVNVRFEVLMATSVKVTAFWDVAKCRVRKEDGGSKLLCNVGKNLPDYTMQHPRRQSSCWLKFSTLTSRVLINY